MLILSEDLALKTRLQGMVVSDGDTASRKVGVWFGQPDKEIRAQDFPFIIINLIGMTEARERVHSANTVELPYVDPPVSPAAGESVRYDRPIPLNLDYQVSSFARHPRHDRQLLNQLLYLLPMRGGLIAVTHDQVDNQNKPTATARRMDFLTLNKRDRIEDNKRLFVNDIVIRISSEMAPERYDLLPTPPTSLVTDLTGSVAPGDSGPSPWGPNPGPPDPLDPDVPDYVQEATASGVTIWGT